MRKFLLCLCLVLPATASAQDAVDLFASGLGIDAGVGATVGNNIGGGVDVDVDVDAGGASLGVDVNVDPGSDVDAGVEAGVDLGPTVPTPPGAPIPPGAQPLSPRDAIIRRELMSLSDSELRALFRVCQSVLLSPDLYSPIKQAICALVADEANRRSSSN